MSLFAVQQYVADTLDGLTVTGTNIPQCQAWVLPPPVTQPIEYPQLYIWGGRAQEKRATLPRPLGQKRRQHQIDIYVQWVADNSNENLSIALFPVLLEQIVDTLAAVQLPVDLLDPFSGQVSSLTDFGENINWQYATPLAIQAAGGTLLSNNAQIKVLAYEWRQG